MRADGPSPPVSGEPIAGLLGGSGSAQGGDFHVFANPNAFVYASAHIDSHTDSDRYAHVFARTDTNPDSNTLPDSRANPDCNALAHSNEYADPYSDTVAHSHRYSDQHSDTVSYTH